MRAHTRERDTQREREREREQMESSTEGKSQTGDRLVVMQEVANIRRCTARLEGIFKERELLQGDPVSEAIFNEIRFSAERASLLLDAAGGWDKMTPPMPECGPEASVASPSSVDQMNSNISMGKRKVSQSGDGRRVCCRRRSQQSAGIRVENKKTLDDGHQWRKYGQKDILGSNYPRSYFRCTHKRDQGCKAQRQVQRLEGDPSKFIITYIDEHTCRDLALAPEFVSPPNSKGSCIISFEGNTTDHKGCLPTTVPSLKMEHDDELSNLTAGSSSSNNHVLHEATATPAAILPVIAPPTPADAGAVPPFPASSVPTDLFMTENNFDLDVMESFYYIEGFFELDVGLRASRN